MLSTYIVLSFIFLLIVLVFVYIIIYNKNANNVLKTGKRNVLLDKGKYLNIFLVIGAFSMMLFMLINMNALKQDVKNLSGQLTNIERRITWLNGRVGSLEDELKNYIEGQKNIYDISYHMTGADTSKKTIEVELSFKLREVDLKNTYVIEVVNQENHDDIEEIIIENDTNQMVKLNLLYDQRYEVYLIETTETVRRSYDIRKIDMKNLSNDYVKASVYETDQSIYLQVSVGKKLDIAAFDLTGVNLIIKDHKQNQIVFNQDVFAEMIKEDAYVYVYKIDNKYDFNTHQFDVIITNGFGVVLEMNAL